MTKPTFRLRSYLSDGFAVDLEGRHPTEAHAIRAASIYARHYSDPCGLGVRVSRVAIIEVQS